MSKRFTYGIAGIVILCVAHHNGAHGCKICTDANGSIRKPFFYQVDENNIATCQMTEEKKEWADLCERIDHIAQEAQWQFNNAVTNKTSVPLVEKYLQFHGLTRANVTLNLPISRKS
jgi:hypothetical protein